MRKGLICVVAAAAVLLAGAAATSDAGRFASVATAGSVTIGLETDPGNLDPHLTIIGAARTVGTFSYDTLVNLVGPGKVVSGLAQSWKVRSPKRVEFTLRRGITCSDGSALTATVVKRNLDFVGNPANQSPLLGLFMPVGATTVANDRARTVVVTTSMPNPFMLQGLGLVQIVCAKALDNRKLLDRGTLGTGPYKLVSAVAGDHYTFALRKGYAWGPGGATSAGMPAQVTLRVVTNESTVANLLLSGGLNAAPVSGADRSRLDRARLFKKETISTQIELFFNENEGHATADPRIRKALVQALNLGQVGTVATAGRGVRMTQMTRQDQTPCAGNSVVGAVPAQNVQAARSVLASARPKIKLLYPTDAGAAFAPAAELTQQQLRAAGADVTLAPSGTAALQGIIFGTGDWDVLLIAIGVTTPAQLGSLVSGPAPPRGANFGGIANADYRKAVARAVRRTGAQGCKYWLEAERALFRAADVAPLSALTTAYYGKGVTFALGPQGPLPTSLRVTR